MDSVVTYLLENLPPLLLQEYNLPKDVAEKIKLLLDQMGILNAIIKVAERKRNQHEIIREVVGQMRDAVHEAEDVIDAYIYDVNRQRTKKWWDVVNYVDHSMMLHDLASKIDSIKVRIEEIQRKFPPNDHGEAEVADAAAATAAAELNERRTKVEEDDVVGFEKYSEVVINMLAGGRQQLDVITIYGMPGLGKTTLARKIYKNDKVKRYFHFCLWNHVSEDCEVNNLLLKLLAQVGSELNRSSQEMSGHDLKDELHKCLKLKNKYILVLDDIWEPEVWVAIKDAFPDEKNGSRILITSRSEQVANSASRMSKYELPPLSKNKSWELLSKRVFGGEEYCPPELEDLAKQMAESCDGLPLSIVVLAGLLARLDMSKSAWSVVAGNEIWRLFQEKAKCRDILALSYNYLPRPLKPCFLYVGLYPEDFKIPARQLIHLWLAEGLIQEDPGNKQPEDVAELYLWELISRSLIQVESKRSDGGVKTCRIHDLLRALSIDESKKDKFYEVYTGNGNPTFAKPRRLSLYREASSYLSSSLSTHHSSVRSLICFAKESIHYRESYKMWRNDVNAIYWESILKDFKLVRVLDIYPARVSFDIPPDILQLLHLRYLRLDAAYISEEICKLWNLETLDLRGSMVTLPTEIWKLKRLRHLLLSGPVMMKRPYGSLDYLQTLSTVALEDPLAFFFSKMSKLRKLGLYHSSNLRWEPRIFWLSLGSLSNLKTLKIIGTTKLPRWAGHFPLYLKKMTLKDVDGLPSDIMALLGAISNLEILKLLGSALKFYEFDIDSKTGEFKKLEVFQMRELRCRNWNLARGAMPRLQSLSIIDCETLSTLPDELWSLANLRDVRVSKPSEPLTNMLGKLKMKNGCKLTILKD